MALFAHVALEADVVVALRKARIVEAGPAVTYRALLIVPPTVSGATPTLKARRARDFSESVFVLADAPRQKVVKNLTATTVAHVPRQAPLSTLLSRGVSAAFTTEFERRLSDAGFPELTFSLGTNVLRSS